MEYLHSIMFKLIETIKFIFNWNFDIFNLVKILLLLFITFIILVHLYKLLISFISNTSLNTLLNTSFNISFKNKNIIYDKSLLKIYKLLKNKNFFSKKLVNDILKKIKKNKVTIINFNEDRNIKLFKFINKNIKIKYKLNNEDSINVIFYLYYLIDKIN